MDYITVYIEIAVVTIVYMTVLFFNVRKEMGDEWEVNLFRGIIFSLILAIIADAVTQAQYRGFLHMNHILVAFLYGFYMFIFSGVLPFLWFVFVEKRLGGELLENRAAVIISMIPLAIVSFMAFASMKTGWFYEVDEYGIYTRGRYWTLQVVVNYIYFLFTTIHAFLVARKEPSVVQRRQYYIMASFVVAPFIGGLFQLFIGNHPFVAPSVSISMLLVFINIQGNLIHNDSLTGLFNRMSAERYIDELKADASESKPFYIYKMRIEGLRAINYMHGYAKGDQAIKTVARVLQRVTKRYGALVASLGGVDFLAVMDNKNFTKRDDLEEAVKEALEKEVKRRKLPYDLNLAIGRTQCTSSKDKTRMMIHDADREMHLDETI